MFDTIRNVDPRPLIYFIIFFNLAIQWLICTFGVPSAASYVSDVLIACIGLLAVIHKNAWGRIKALKTAKWFALVFFAVCVVSGVASFHDPILFAWGLWSNFRHFIVFFASILFFTDRDIPAVIKALMAASFLHLLLSLYQHAAYGTIGDSLGGLYSWSSGATNGSLLILVIGTTYSLFAFSYKKVKPWVPVLFISLALLVAVFAEIKAFFALLPFIVATWLILGTLKPREALTVALTIGIILMLSVPLFFYLNPDFAGFTEPRNVVAYLVSDQGYSTSGDINRLTAFQQLSNYFSSPIDYLLGIGLGNALFSANFEMLVSPFYAAHSNLHYEWFTHSMIFLEIGILGIASYFGFYLAVAFDCIAVWKKNRFGVPFITPATAAISILCPCLCILGNALKLENTATVLFAILSLPFIAAAGRASADDPTSRSVNLPRDRRSNPKISVIVPVYNVEKYVDRCLKSILEQSYENIEILVVNDGSTDGSGAICEKYASGDRRIRLFQTTNRGLGAARNYAIDRCSGDYITFVDSDDWLEPSHIERLYVAAEHYQADIVSSGFTMIDADLRVANRREAGPAASLQPCDALKEMLSERTVLDNCLEFQVADKLFSKKAIGDIRFPAGIPYEDMATTYKFVLRSNRLIKANSLTYNYRYVRPGSIINSFSSGKLAIFSVLSGMDDYLKESHPELCRLVHIRHALAAVILLREALRAGADEATSKQIYKEMQTYRKEVLLSKEPSLKLKVSLLISYLGYPLCRKILTLV